MTLQVDIGGGDAGPVGVSLSSRRVAISSVVARSRPQQPLLQCRLTSCDLYFDDDIPF